MAKPKKENSINTVTLSEKQSIKPLKKKVAVLKIVGSFILLLSFATQNFFYDRSNARINDLVAAMHDRQIIDKGAMLQELLYFSAINSANTLKGIDASVVASSKIRFSAIKVAGSVSVAVNTAKIIQPDEATVVLKELFARANQVNDYKELVTFFSYVNENFESHAKALNTQYEEESKSRANARNIYLLMYITGTLFLLLGLIFECCGIEE